MKRVLQLMRMTLNRIGNQLIIIVLQMLQIRKTEMRNIKIVDVYTGYGENSISWIKEDRFGGEIKNIVDDVFEKYVVDKMRADDWEEFSDDGEEMMIMTL